MGVKSADIAKLAGVSRSAVSAVLNGHYNKVSLANREKILSIARDLQYRPNPAALVLAKKTTRRIGLITSPFLSAIYSDLVSKISFQLHDLGYTCSVVLPTDSAHELEIIRHFEAFGTDGIIGAYFLNDLRNLNCTIPVLSMSPYPKQYELRVDLKLASKLALEHLRGHGHRKIGLLCPRTEVVPLQLEGYLEALDTAPAYCLEATRNPDFEKNLDKLLNREKVTAFLATNDLLAARFQHFLNARGIRIPEDVALVGFDGTAFTETLSCPLTTVVFPSAALAKRSVEMLMEKIEHNERSFRKKPEYIPPRLHLGASCGCRNDTPPEMFWDGQTLTLDER